jgi:hypothetical protein
MAESDSNEIPAFILPDHKAGWEGYYKCILAEVRRKNYLRFERFMYQYHGSQLNELLTSLGVGFETYPGKSNFPLETGDDYSLIGAGAMELDIGGRKGIIRNNSSQKYTKLPRFQDEPLERVKRVLSDWTFEVGIVPF